ncbi:hypothetical protein HanXRQr2_Chr12g0535611 [Helianthus annuus]|uniref:Uncharacterized protein n=1 Tax=Helianthus annuus TaxID=4232 RepID=A0A251T467_HELAN|nr:hypothetical protein HanXRQr2_Chr12g0535611 [Helianthus annuus]KAJ0492635.1 hypothetical protein HanIR_Chr12g0577081 [Helianthus annuus]KAJ0862249.1 hypothetical protein HanPSC8_Chr12g0515921 [Helianthus annuus]
MHPFKWDTGSSINSGRIFGFLTHRFNHLDHIKTYVSIETLASLTIISTGFIIFSKQFNKEERCDLHHCHGWRTVATTDGIPINDVTDSVI